MISISAALLSSVLLHPSCPASFLSCISHVLHLPCLKLFLPPLPEFLPSCISPLLHPSCHAFLISLSLHAWLRPVLRPSCSLVLKWKIEKRKEMVTKKIGSKKAKISRNKAGFATFHFKVSFFQRNRSP